MDMVLLLGVVTGMRSMTAIAVLSWAAWLQLIPEHGWAGWIGSLAAVIVFTLCAIGEYVADTLPKTPNRTSVGPAIGRVIIAGVVGLLVAKAIGEPLAGGVILGAVGALIGTWGSFWVRMGADRIVKHDLPVALLESTSAIVIAVWAVMRVHGGIVLDIQRAMRP
jgi:uncharacterized membrane protein